MDEERRRSLFALLAAVTTVAIALGALPLGFAPIGDDADRLYKPLKTELARDLRAGIEPWWSDRFGLGFPLIAESHIAAFYPPNRLFYRVLDVPTAARFSLWVHALLLVSTTFLYARFLKISPTGSAFAGVVFALCGYFSAHVIHEPHVHVLSYMPLILWLAERYLAAGGFARIAGLALVVGVQLTLGQFQFQMLTLGLVVFLTLWRVSFDRLPARRGFGVALGIAWGLAIAAIQLGPTWELAQFSGMTGRSAGELAAFAYPPAHWSELVCPRLFASLPGGPNGAYWRIWNTSRHEAIFYVGTIPLIFAMIGIASSRIDRSLRPWAVLALLGFCLASLPILWPEGFELLTNVPGVGFFRGFSRYTVVSSFAFALLAGRGFGREIEARETRSGIRLAMGFACVGVAWALWWCLSEERRQSLDGQRLWIVLGIAAVNWTIGIVAAVLWKRGKVPAGVPLSIAVIELTVLFYNGPTRWDRVNDWTRTSPVFKQLARESRVGLVAGALDDLPTTAGFRPAYPYFGMRLPVEPYKILEAARTERISNDPRMLKIVDRWLSRYGVSHGIWDGPPPSKEAGSAWKTLYDGPDPVLDRLAPERPGAPKERRWRLVRSSGVFPQARAAIKLGLVPSPGALLTEDLGGPETAWITREDNDSSLLHLDARSARVESWDGTVAIVEHDGACLLVVSRMFYPGWKAIVDEALPVAVSRVDGGLQAVRIGGSGRSRVRFEYAPTNRFLFALVSIASTATAFLFFVTSRLVGMPYPTKLLKSLKY